MSEPKIIEVSETQRGEWIETRWSDGCVTLHRNVKATSIQQENASVNGGDGGRATCENALRFVKEHRTKFGPQIPLAEFLVAKWFHHDPTGITSSIEDFRRAIEEVYKEQLEDRRPGLLC
jgi:hypothetical protein